MVLVDAIKEESRKMMEPEFNLIIRSLTYFRNLL
jgi:hypothetical protein